MSCTVEGFAVGEVPGAVIGAAAGLAIGYSGSKVNWRAVGEFIARGNWGNGDSPALERHMKAVMNSYEKSAEEENKGTSGGDRAGKRFTPKGKQEIHDQNAQQNGGENR